MLGAIRALVSLGDVEHIISPFRAIFDHTIAALVCKAVPASVVILVATAHFAKRGIISSSGLNTCGEC